MKQHYPVIVVGGGQAGLSISYCLKERSIEHLVLEKNQIGYAWRTKRWDSFCLVTPNWQCSLPGYHYPGNDPQGFMQQNEIVDYVKSYAASFNPPIKEGVEVLSARRQSTGVFEVTTSANEYTTNQLVVASGSYHRPKIPSLAQRLPEAIVQMHSSEYKNPESLSDKAVLVIGTGQSGCQIAEDLHLAGKQVHLCVGGAPRAPRRYRGKDVLDWLDQMGYYDMPIDEHPQKKKVRSNANHYVTGRDGGRDIDLRRFALEGMRLYGRLKNIGSSSLEFQNDLKQNLDHADAVAESIKTTIDKFIGKNGIEAPLEPPYQPVWEPAEDISTLNYEAENIGTVIWCTGYRSDFNWVEIPVFDGKGYPGHERGITPVWGLYFLGLPWLYTWGSGRFSGVARDAIYLADYIQARQQVSHSKPVSLINDAILGS